MLSGALNWAGKNPVLLAFGVFIVGAIVLIAMRKPVQVVDSGMGAFYAAQAASTNSGNQLAAVQAQVAGATAIAGIAANRDATIADIGAKLNAEVNTVRAQTDIELARVNQAIVDTEHVTRQMIAKQQFFLATGQNQLQGQSLPYLIQLAAMGGAQSQAASDIMRAQIAGATKYTPSFV
jgi:hypothetical protein